MDQQQQQPPVVPIPNEIRTFLEGLLQQSQIPVADEQTKENLIQDLFYELDTFLSNVIVNNLQQEDLNTFIKMNEEKKPKEELEAFIQQKIPDSQKVFTDAFVAFRDMYLEDMAPKPTQTPVTETAPAAQTPSTDTTQSTPTPGQTVDEKPF